MNGATFYHLKMKNILHGRVKEDINDPLLFNQRHMMNYIINPFLSMMTLEDTNKPMMDEVIYYVYKTDKHME